MPDAKGRIKGIVSPGVPWCLRCKLVKCECASEHVLRARAKHRSA